MWKLINDCETTYYSLIHVIEKDSYNSNNKRLQITLTHSKPSPECYEHGGYIKIFESLIC